ncbi:MAG: DEAD/DEAH box helicase [Bacteroidales bacterium]
MTTFQNLNLSAPLLQALKGKGYKTPTPVQAKAIPVILQGRDIFGSARTGTGKTAAFALPLLDLLESKQKAGRHPRALILAPTRELAGQISENIRIYGKHTRISHTVIYGGVSQKEQVAALRKGKDIIVATPGRLLDLIQQKYLSLHAVEHFILDEADRMLDMGFINDIKKISTMLPDHRQSMLFSATLLPAVKKLAATMLRNPVSVDIEPDTTQDSFTKEQVYHIGRASKAALLQHLVREEGIDRTLVFTRTRRGADKLVKSLARQGIMAQAIHGDKSQNQRQRALNQFKNHKLSMLVATDVASRGIDVSDLSHVINYDMPEQEETYTHRIGRTGRAGKDGTAYSFCSPEEKLLLKGIQRFTGKNIPVGQIPAELPVAEVSTRPPSASGYAGPKQGKGGNKTKQSFKRKNKRSRHETGVRAA